MDILNSIDGDVVVLRFVGDFDILDVDRFEAHVDEAIKARQLRVLVDASEMRLINSSAIQSLLRAQARLKEGGGDLAMAGISPFVTSIFATLGIDRRIRCLPDESRGLEWLRRAPGADAS